MKADAEWAIRLPLVHESEVFEATDLGYLDSS